MKIAVIGLGYVGLPLALQFARSGVTVLGLDVDQSKVDAIHSGKSYIKHIEGTEVLAHVDAGTFSADTDFSRVSEVEAVIICVPTPLNKYREPDLSYVLATGKAIAPFLGGKETGVRSQESEEELVTVGAGLIKNEEPGTTNYGQPSAPNQEQSTKNQEHPPGSNQEPRTKNQKHAQRKKLVVLESTTYPGTTDEDLRAVLEEGSGLTAGVDFHLAFSPEREDPGRKDHSVKTIPKVMGGLTPACLERCVELYSKALDKVHAVGSCRVAEATKLTENIFRAVNIALVNELKMVFHKMDIDVWDVIDAAATKPFGFMPFYPGPGLGGHCIPIDPFYLTWKAREFDQHTRFIELAGEINTNMPKYVVSRVGDTLNADRKSINGSRILIVGLAYKPNVDDDRESPSYVLMDLLTEKGAEVAYYDPYVPVIRPTRAHAHWTGTESVPWNEETISDFDCVVVSTAHAAIDFRQLADWASCIVDTRNAMAKAGVEGKNVIKA